MIYFCRAKYYCTKETKCFCTILYKNILPILYILVLTITYGAIRELKEELGVETKEKDLQYISTIKSTKNPKNMEFGYVYLLKCNNQVEEYTFEDDEVSEVKYVYFEELEKMVEERVDGLLIHKEEYKKLFEFIRENY